MPSLELAVSNNASQARSAVAPSQLDNDQFSLAAADGVFDLTAIANPNVPSITTRGNSKKTNMPVAGSAVSRDQDVIFGKKYE